MSKAQQTTVDYFYKRDQKKREQRADIDPENSTQSQSAAITGSESTNTRHSVRLCGAALPIIEGQGRA